jgi:hypothetical protein
MSALYLIANQYLSLAEKLADGDFDAQTIADTIEASGISDELAVKAQGIEFVARSAEQHHVVIDAEIARLQALKTQRTKVADGLRAYLLDNMQRTGIEKIDCPLFSINIRKNPPAVEIIDQLSLPAKFMVTPEPVPPVAKPDKKAIGEALKSGEEVTGARLVQGVRLNIK